MIDGRFWSRLRETHLVRTLLIYLAAAWVTLQVLTIFSGAFDWPPWIMRSAIWVLGVGLVTTLILAWIAARAQVGAESGEDEPRRTSRAVALVIGIAALLALGAGVFFGTRERGAALAPGDLQAETAGTGIAIVPFTVNDDELVRWREGLVDLLSKNLDGAGGLRAIDSRTVLARWRESVPEGGTADLPTALEVARRSGGRYGIIGSVVSSGTAMRIVTEVHDLETGDVLGERRVEGVPDSIFSLVDRLSIDLLELLVEEEGGDVPSIDLARITTRSVPALKSFIEGESMLRRSDFDAAIPAYTEAIDADSTFGLAYFRLSEAEGWLEAGSPEAQTARDRALALQDRLPVREADLLAASIATAEATPDATDLSVAVTEKYPDDARAWFQLGEAYFHQPHQSIAGRSEKEAAFSRALELDPGFTSAYLHLLDVAIQYADSARAYDLFGGFEGARGGGRSGVRYETVLGLAFGDAEHHAAAEAVFDSMSTRAAATVVSRLTHPRLLALQADLLHSLVARDVARGEPGAEAMLAFLLTTNLLRRARTDEALERIDLLPEGRPRERFLTISYEVGAPIPDELITSTFQMTPDTFPNDAAWVTALRALNAGDTTAARRIGDAIHPRIAELEAQGDHAFALEVTSAIQALEGRIAMLRGDDDLALELLDTSLRVTSRGGVTLWIADIHERAGRIEQAIRYLESLGPEAWIGNRLGRLYDQIGGRDQAVEAYGWVVDGWVGAEPRVLPLVIKAEREINRLRGLQIE